MSAAGSVFTVGESRWSAAFAVGAMEASAAASASAMLVEVSFDMSPLRWGGSRECDCQQPYASPFESGCSSRKHLHACITPRSMLQRGRFLHADLPPVGTP